MNVLLVDDDQICNFLAKKILERVNGIGHITAVQSGQEALRLLIHSHSDSGFTPDLIFLDLNMPVMDGFEFLEHYHKLNLPGRDVMKVIVLSSSNSPSDLIKAKNLGAVEYLIKPLKEKDLNLVLAKR